ncbi:MAG: pantoate--beta-alanine ligase [Eubacteriales bacterium]
MRVISTIKEMKSAVREVRGQGKSVGFVPTMGYLHNGHLTLMQEAKSKTDFVVVSIFVNPLQFGVGEDYEDYPRDLSRDSSLAESAGVDIIFAPTVREMYPKGYATFVEVEKLTGVLCGKSRPGHFKGVTTVVTKLFNIVEPDIALFGQKDAQQSIVLKKMVEDLNMNLKIEIVPIVREKDGLAMSSRNSYLNSEERRAALALSQSLEMARELIASGERNNLVLVDEIRKFISREPLARIDYVEILSVPDLEKTEFLQGSNLIALAVFIGNTRLIDNMVLEG